MRTFVQRAGRYFGDPSSRKQGLKKTYVLNIEGKNRERLLDAGKHDIRKYVKRERAKDLPEGVDFWDFECKTGACEQDAAPVHFAEIMGSVDALVNDGADQFYIEITSKPGHRVARPKAVMDDQTVSDAL